MGKLYNEQKGRSQVCSDGRRLAQRSGKQANWQLGILSDLFDFLWLFLSGKEGHNKRSY